MNELLQELLQNPLAVSVTSALIGCLLTVLFNRLSHKSGVLGYTMIWNRVGVSADHDVFGPVRVFWNDIQVRNLFVYNIEVENSSSSDYENVKLHFFAGRGTQILSEQTEVLGEPRIVDWSPEFRERLRIPEGAEATETQLEEYRRNRKYRVPVLNRGQKLGFTFLCTKPEDDTDPSIYLSTDSKGVRLKRRRPPFVILNPIFGVPIPVALARGLVIAVVVLIACILFVKAVWLAALLSVIVGLACQPIGALVYRVERFLRDAASR